MGEKENAERYLVVMLNSAPATVWAEDFEDVLHEIKESGIDIEKIVHITRLDF